MSSVSFVDRAKDMACYLEDQEYVRVGDRKIARVSVARKCGIAPHVFKSLRYCPPKQIAVDLYHKLCEAVEEAASSQIRQLEKRIHEARQGRISVSEGVVREAETALREAVALLNGGAK